MRRAARMTRCASSARAVIGSRTTEIALGRKGNSELRRWLSARCPWKNPQSRDGVCELLKDNKVLAKRKPS